ncbi:hypothetical protein fh0823_17140 [Francisella halioticida]|uniref:heavy-metal-associated domain-containing protein n=1 Tax=Francisella halioticida TaxID=549298 RepID=UPI001AFB7929|nr:heavy-metal-associated domain-containing protein [Francisella halioticida]BCD91575.1 hypothetical protein fh0823_17140 [Francisella halioticida]
MSSSNQYLEFKVYGLDCVEEVNIIKKALGKKVLEENMQFDLLNGKLLIDQQDISTKEIISSIKKSGLSAVIWQDYISNNQNPSFIDKHLRLITTLISGILIVFAYLLHAFDHGFNKGIYR